MTLSLTVFISEMRIPSLHSNVPVRIKHFTGCLKKAVINREGKQTRHRREAGRKRMRRRKNWERVRKGTGIGGSRFHCDPNGAEVVPENRVPSSG